MLRQSVLHLHALATLFSIRQALLSSPPTVQCLVAPYISLIKQALRSSQYGPISVHVWIAFYARSRRRISLLPLRHDVF